MASPPTSAAVPQIPETPVSRRWLTLVRFAAVVCMVPIALFVLVSSFVRLPFSLLLGGAFGWYAWWLFSRLFGAKVKEGLAGAIGAGGATVIVAVIIAVIIPALSTLGRTWQEWAAASLIVVVPGILSAAAIRAYSTMRREPGDRRILAKGLGLGALFFFVLNIAVALTAPRRHRTPMSVLSWNQASAIVSLRTINTAEATYADTYKAGFSPTLAALGPPLGNAQPSASAARLIDSVLASGVKREYRITYTPGPPDKTGQIKTYTVAARPVQYGKSGRMSFFTDESGVIRKTDDDRPATAKDPPLGG